MHSLRPGHRQQLELFPGVCVCTCVFVCMCVCMCVYVCVRVANSSSSFQKSVCICVCVSVCVCVCVCVCCKRLGVRTCERVHACPTDSSSVQGDPAPPGLLRPHSHDGERARARERQRERQRETQRDRQRVGDSQRLQADHCRSASDALMNVGQAQVCVAKGLCNLVKSPFHKSKMTC